jgi:2-amino-4-hydroxy-6-hydroxymethyldihydropteridine diphosphokinase
MKNIYVALGSNLNNPIYQVKKVVDHLRNQSDVKILNLSSLYQTKPVGITNQPDFINAVIEIEYHETPKELLKLLLDIEKFFGRVRLIKNGPRIIDLDIILFDQTILNEGDLVIPHPRMFERNFVMLPLMEIAPNLKINEIPIETLVRNISTTDIIKITDGHF